MQEKILIIEDDRKIAELVKLYLEKEGFKVTIADDGKQGLEKINKENPDLIVLDLMLPEIDGLTIARSVREENNIPIIMLTAKDEETDKIVGLEIGADDYIAKPFSPKELSARVRAVLRRSRASEASKNKKPIKISDLEIIPEKFEVLRLGKQINLTRREFNLLLTFAKQPGIVFSRSDLMHKIYTFDDEIVFDRTIDVHIANLRQKLNDKGQELIITVKGVGYKLKA
ncbi:MAG: response regulator transcription factor [Candidatus Moranbacteria bacterium]|nr:response regulator transcription factor [Candidatus Moranbacteria bacterium]